MLRRPMEAARQLARGPWRAHSTTAAGTAASTRGTGRRRALPDDQRTLGDFIATRSTAAAEGGAPSMESEVLAYAPPELRTGAAEPRTFTIESYGCQMNSSDSEVGGWMGLGRLFVSKGDA